MAARKSTGGVVEPKGQRRSWGIRFRAYGRRYTVALGTPAEGWNRARAEEELANVLADVRRGIWQPPSKRLESVERAADPTFHEFASTWLRSREPELKSTTVTDYAWRLSSHLLPYFAPLLLSEITVERVDRYRQSKVSESLELAAAREEMAKRPPSERERLHRPLSNGSINKTIRLLASILEQAVEYGHLDRNPARGRKRLLQESRPTRSFLQPDQALALLAAAAAIDANAKASDLGRRHPLLAAMVLGGLRIGEALNLKWRNLSLGKARMTIVTSKTDAGRRDVVLSPILLKTLTEYRSRAAYTDPDDYVFPTSTGNREGESNVRRRVLAPAIERANESLEKEGADPIQAISPHGLRRTFISLLLFARIDLRRVMAEVGHTDPKMTLSVYAQVMTVDDDFGVVLTDLVGRGLEAGENPAPTSLAVT